MVVRFLQLNTAINVQNYRTGTLNAISAIK